MSQRRTRLVGLRRSLAKYPSRREQIALGGEGHRCPWSVCFQRIEAKTVSVSTYNQTGWYYILVMGYNGDNNAQPYTLSVDLSHDSPSARGEFSVPVFNTPDFVAPEVTTLILANRSRLEAKYGQPAIQILWNKLANLAQNPAVKGQVIDLATYPALSQAYQVWDQAPADIERANYVADSIKAWIVAYRAAYSNLKYLVIVGNDSVIPFHRIPDESSLSNERDYISETLPDSAVGIALKQRYYLSDDFYASYSAAQPWRGRYLYLPDLAIGRLVENPVEMGKMVDVFLSDPTPYPRGHGLPRSSTRQC